MRRRWWIAAVLAAVAGCGPESKAVAPVPEVAEVLATPEAPSTATAAVAEPAYMVFKGGKPAAGWAFAGNLDPKAVAGADSPAKWCSTFEWEGGKADDGMLMCGFDLTGAPNRPGSVPGLDNGKVAGRPASWSKATSDPNSLLQIAVDDRWSVSLSTNAVKIADLLKMAENLQVVSAKEWKATTAKK